MVDCSYIKNDSQHIFFSHFLYVNIFHVDFINLYGFGIFESEFLIIKKGIIYSSCMHCTSIFNTMCL